MESGVNWKSRIRLVDEVAQVLRERIYSGSYALGEQLRQEALAEDLDVSRTPLREALRILENEGLLHSEPGRGVRVVSADRKKLLAAYQLREMIDGLAARLAAQSADVEARQELLRLVDAQRVTLEPWDAGHYTLSNVDFHTAVIALADNEYVTSQIPLVRMTSQVFTPVRILEPERAAAAVSEHAVVAQAIADGDGQEAERLARLHIRGTIDRLTSA